MGPKTLVDVHILLDDPKLSVSEGHQISETARAELIRKFQDIEDVTVHIDPEDDEVVAQGRHLGLRGEIEAKLRAAWSDVPEGGSDPPDHPALPRRQHPGGGRAAPWPRARPRCAGADPAGASSRR